MLACLGRKSQSANVTERAAGTAVNKRVKGKSLVESINVHSEHISCPVRAEKTC